MSEHTAGPWELRSNRRGFHIFSAAKDKIITLPTYTTEANVNLITAAPDLLEALEALLLDLKERATFENGGRVLACGTGVLYQTEKALAKARGPR